MTALIIQLVAYGLLLAYLVATFVRERRAKKLQNALLDELQPGFAPQQRWFRVNVASQPFFMRRMRMSAFEAKGLLIDAVDVVRIVAVTPDGKRLDQVVPKLPESIRWRGNAGLRAANLHWMELGAGPQALMVAADTGVNAALSRESTADLMRALLPKHPLDASARQEFALEKHPATLATMVVALALLAASLVDITVTEHQLLEPRELRLIGAPAALLGLLVYPLLLRRKVPSRESMGLSFLAATALAIAAPAAILRLDQWLSSGPEPTSYRLVDGARLQPVEAGPPPVTLNDVREYWRQFEPGSVHELDIVHGPLGTWQLDRRRLNAETREWYGRPTDTR